MAEFCYECYRKILKGDVEKNRLIISKDFDLCEGCGELKHAVIKEKKPSLFSFFKRPINSKDTHS